MKITEAYEYLAPKLSLSEREVLDVIYKKAVVDKPQLCDGWRKFPEEDPATYRQPHGSFLVYAHHIDLNCHCFEIMSYFPDWIGEKWMGKGGSPIRCDKVRVLAFRELVPPAFA